MRSIRLIMVGLLTAAACVGVAGAAPFGSVTEFSDGVNQAAALNPYLLAGPDGNLWFTDKGTASKATDSAIGKIDPQTGVISEVGITESGGNVGSAPRFVVAGPDGNMWFTDGGSSNGGTGPPAIGKLDLATGKVSEFSTGLNARSFPYNAALGPDGKLWFNDRGTTRAIGTIDAATGAITEFPIPTNQTSLPIAIAAGPDGDLWFTESTPGTIGKIDPTTRAITLYTTGLNPGSAPNMIAAGPDGEMWFTDNGSTKGVGKIDPSTGTITEYLSRVPSVSSLAGNSLTLSQSATANGSSTLTFRAAAMISVTAGSTSATVITGLAGLFPGMLTSNNFPPGTSILSISGSVLTLSAAANGSNASLSAVFSATVAGVTTTAGSPTLGVSAGGFPSVVVGDTVSGPGIPAGILNPGAIAQDIAEAPDGNMWFADPGTGVIPATPAIAVVNPATGQMSEFTKPPGMASGSRPQGLALGPEGNLWFTDNPTSSASPQAIGRFGLGVCGNSLQGCNFQGRNLDNIVLTGAALQGDNFQSAQLENANLIGANLQGDNLRNAQLESYAHLNWASLQGSNLQHANLAGADLSNANLQGCNLQGANLTGANLTNANLAGANLRGASVTGVTWTGANLAGANLPR